jgi:transposase-like protein
MSSKSSLHRIQVGTANDAASVRQDHQRVKRRIYPVLGFKSFEKAAITISGIELVQKIKKGQFDISEMVSGVEL